MTAIGAARQSKLIAVSVAPSINYTSHKRNSTAPYILTQSLDNAQNIAKHTYLNGKPAYILTQTSQPTCIGDASGIGGGVRSGTIGKQIKPTQGANNIFVEGKPLIRQNDPCTMNNSNTQGKYIALVPATPQQSTAAATLLKALPIIPGGQTISQALGGIATLSDAHNALKQGNLLGSAMSVANLIPNPKVSQGLGMLNTGMQAAHAFQQGNLLGGAMSAASLIPNEKVAQGLGIINTGLQIGQQLAQGATLDAGMSIASMIPGSEKIMPMIHMGRQLMSDLKPSDVLIKNFAPDSHTNNQATSAPTAPTSVAPDKGSPQTIGGTIVKGQGGELACKQCALANQNAMIGAPVNALYGSKVLSGSEDIDYIGRGYLSFGLIRIYNSQNSDIGWFGQGWKSQGYEQRLQLDPQHDRIHLLDNSGRPIPFCYLAPGEYCYQPYENLTLYRLPLDSNAPPISLESKPLVADAVQATRIAQDEPLRFVVFTGQYKPTSQIAELFNLSSDKQDTPAGFAGTALYFDHTSERNAQGTKATLLASGLIDNRGHRLHLYYTHPQNSPVSHLPQYITDDADDCYRLEFKLINNQPRLTDLYLVQDINKPTSLFHYQYSTEGDLTAVIKQGKTVREFSYTNHLMTWQKLPNGQQAHYRYDQTEHAKTARVIHHWLDNGQNYHFDYRTDENGIHHSTVTEQQGTELERTRHYQYNDDYYLTAFTDPLGHQTRYQYDELNRITQIITPIGSRTLMTYQGNLLDSIAVQTSISPLTGLPVYRETHYQYDKAGNLTGITDALGQQRQFSYNANHDVVTSIDALGNQTHFDYDPQGNLIRQTLANGSYYSFEYNELGQLIRQTDCSNNTTTYHYDEIGRVILVTDPMGKQTQYHYDQRCPTTENTVQTASGAEQSQDNATEQPPTLQLTTAPSHVLHADGHKEHFIYDSHNRLIQYRDNAGLITQYHYTKDGLPQSRTNPNTTKLDYAYDSLRRLTCLTNENGERWTFHYDKADNLIRETRFDGYTSRYQYDEMGQLIHQIDNTQSQHHQRYDERHTYLERDLIGQLLHKHCLDYELDEADKLTIYTNPFGQPMSHDDFANRRIAVPQQNKHSTHYTYDLAGRLIKAISPDATTTLDYDAVGNLIEETLQRHHSDASFDIKLNEGNNDYGNIDEDDNETATASLNTLTQTLQHNYDVLGNRISTTLPDGKVINQLYYGSGHLYNQSLCYCQDNQEQVIELRHSQRDSLHREISRQQGELLSEFSYDPMGRLVKQHSRYDERVVIERGYHYDSIGQLTHIAGHSQLSHRPVDKPNQVITQSFGRNHQYQYDSVGRLTEHKLSDYQHNTGIQERFAFDPASNRVPVLDNGLVTGLDTALETTKVGHQNDRQHDSQHSRQFTTTPTPPTHQAKDKKWHRTVSLTTQDSQIGYFYDRHGRIKHKTMTPLSKTGEPLPQSVNGLMGYRESLQLFYNANNELCRSIKTRDEGVLVTTTTSRYFYDGFGRRIGKSCEVKEASKLNQRGQRLRFERLRQLAKPVKQTMLMLWDGNRQIQEYTKDHVFTTVFDQDSFVPVARLVWLQPKLWEQSRIAEEKYLASLSDYYLSPTDKAKIKHDSQLGVRVYYYHTDHLGTPQELTNCKGEVVWLGYQRAWGGLFENRCFTKNLDNLEVSAELLQPIRFQGQFYDPENRLHYNRFRYYDYDVGMFIQRDPIGLMGGNNVFAYAPNPIGWVDPLGLVNIRQQQKSENAKEEKSNKINDPKVEFYIKKWLCSATTWEQAFNTAEREKKIPDFNKDPLDDHHRTAAEHYIFMRAMISHESEAPASAAVVFGGFGTAISRTYGAAKKAGLYPSAGKPSPIQTRWEIKGHDDGIADRAGYRQKYYPNMCAD